MRMLHCGSQQELLSAPVASFSSKEDTGLNEYRKMCAKTMKERAEELEIKICHPV